MISKMSSVKETQTTIDSNDLYALPSKSKKICKDNINHIRRPQCNSQEYSQSFLQYLDKNGLKILIHYIDKDLNEKADKIDLINFITKSELSDFKNDLNNIYASKSYVNSLIKQDSLYHLKGSITDLIELENIQNPKVGDTYILTDTGINIVWTGTKWEQFNLIIDLSEYIEFENIQPITIDELDSIINND